MQEVVKFNLKINVIPNGLEEYMSFSINIKLRFTESFQTLCSSSVSLVKNLLISSIFVKNLTITH